MTLLDDHSPGSPDEFMGFMGSSLLNGRVDHQDRLATEPNKHDPNPRHLFLCFYKVATQFLFFCMNIGG